MKRPPRFIAYTVLLSFLLVINPLGLCPVQAAAPTISDIYIERTDNEVLETAKGVIEIRGQDLQGVTVMVRTTGGGGSKRLGIDIGTREADENTYLKFTLPGADMRSILWSDGLVVGETTIPVDDDNMASITGISPNVIYTNTDTLTINGSFLDQDVLSFGNGKVNSDPPTRTATSITINNITGDLGMHDVVFTREILTHPGGITGTLIFRKLYQNQFRVVEELSIADIEMYPNTGAPGKTTVYFQAPVLDKFSVFFLRNGSDPFYLANMGTNYEYIPQEGADDLIKVKVPNLTPGTYQVYFTNYLSDPPSGVDLRNQITKQMLVGEFIIVSTVNAVEVVSVSPESGPNLSNNQVSVVAYNLDELNIDNLTMPVGYTITITREDSDTQLVLDYGTGQYSPGGVAKAVSVKKYIRVIIGTDATFQDPAQQTFIQNNYDTLRILTGIVPDSEVDLDPIRDVVLDIKTVLAPAAPDTNYEFREQAVKENAYTFLKSYVEPVIIKATPDKIQVVNDKIKEEMYIGISGSSFMVTKSTDALGNQVILYPQVRLGSTILLCRDGNDPGNVYDKPYGEAGRTIINNATVEIYNGTTLVDGSVGNDTGTLILIKLPSGLAVNPAEVDIANYIEITNPKKSTLGYGYAIRKNDIIRFVSVSDIQTPVITSLDPNVISTEGHLGVKITGYNFELGVKLFIENQEITCQRDATGREITFNAPPWKQEVTRLLVVNPEGGQDSVEITYVASQTKPTLISISPPIGTINTQVTITGTVFMSPDPTGDLSELGKYRLLGTRVKFGDRDINDYNESGFVAYTSPADDLILTATGLADYYYSVYLQEGANHFYVFKYGKQGQIILTDGIEEYTITGLNAKDNNSNSYTIEVTQSKVTLTGPTTITLNLITPYKFDANGVITGNRVKVTDNGTRIYAIVPNLVLCTVYDVTVVNPDMNTATLQNAFTFTLPQGVPTISSIDPNRGSVAGGYFIRITGTNFEDNGTVKSRVFINTIEVPAADTIVGLDGKTIDVKVPAYPGDLAKDLGVDHKSVPVAVLNSDGGSTGLEDGFTYFIPASKPIIDKLSKTQGNASGGEMITITGSDFRYYEPYTDANGNFTYDAGEEYTDLNGDGSWTDLSSKGSTDGLTDQDLSILPKVYFGSQTASIKSFAKGFLVVQTPAGKAGVVTVYLMNNDSGISNTKQYTYISSTPQISSIIPATGKKQGNELISIQGSGFASDCQVRFGTLGNVSDDTGLIISGEVPEFEIAGGMRVSYSTSNNKTIKFTITQAEIEYTNDFPNYDGSSQLFDMNLLSNGTTTLSAYEKVKVYIKDGRLIVERGYSQQVTLVSAGELTVLTPAYYTIGTVQLQVVNPDGGTATGQFEYKNPATNPVIDNITRDGVEPEEKTVDNQQLRILQVNYKSGSTITITGNDFQNGAIIQVGDLVTISSKDITYTVPTQLSFVMPELPEAAVGSIVTIIVTNEDGGVARSDQPSSGLPIKIQITKGESSPEVSNVIPAMGPIKGGTRVLIKGKDFRESVSGFSGELTVYFGNQKATIASVKYDEIIAITPAADPGVVKVRLENPDGETAEVGTFTYITNPTITTVTLTSESGDEIDASVISVKGGQQLNITGSGFFEGCKVVFMPVIEKSTGSTSSGVIYQTVSRTSNGGESNELDPYVLVSGTDGIEITLIDSNNIKIKTPAGELDAVGIMIINSDQGATPIYEGIRYGFPNPEVSNIIPAMGPVKGGTRVLIKGKDFRQTISGYSGELSVYFGDKKADIVSITSEELIVVTPPAESGDVKVQLKNPDGETVEVGTYTYVSNPTITYVTLTSSSGDEVDVSEISVKGGQQLNIKGTGFLEGCKVVFVPVIEKSTGTNTTGVIYEVTVKTSNGGSSNELDPYVLLSGTEGTEVTVVDDTTVKVKTPQGKLDAAGIMVINKDLGATPIYNGITFGLPRPDAPTGVTAVLVRDEHYDTDRFIKVQWNAVEGAKIYEIEVVIGDKSYNIGSSIYTSLIYKDLEPNTSYKFIVKAVGDFRSSLASMESNVVYTGGTVGPPDIDGGLGEKTQITAKGKLAMICIGSDGEEVNVDLTKSNLAACREVQVTIPARVIYSSSTTITISSKEYVLVFEPGVFQNDYLADSSEENDAGVRFTIYPYSGSVGSAGGNNLSSIYCLEASCFVGQEVSELDQLNGGMRIKMRYDTAKAKLRRFNKMNICWYNPAYDVWIPVNNSGTSMVINLGKYSVIGHR